MLGMDVSPIVIVLIFMLIIFILGMFIDALPIILIVAPVAFPIIINLGYDPIWFGVIFTIGIMTGLVTPPFGYSLFYMRAVAPQEITLIDIYRAVIPFVGIIVLGWGVVIAFPQISLWLPNLLLSLR
jgi:TRAP-type mannitol/chloroaromatic compound transport system permease large subunit